MAVCSHVTLSESEHLKTLDSFHFTEQKLIGNKTWQFKGLKTDFKRQLHINISK